MPLKKRWARSRLSHHQWFIFCRITYGTATRCSLKKEASQHGKKGPAKRLLFITIIYLSQEWTRAHFVTFSAESSWLLICFPRIVSRSFANKKVRGSLYIVIVIAIASVLFWVPVRDAIERSRGIPKRYPFWFPLGSVCRFFLSSVNCILNFYPYFGFGRRLDRKAQRYLWLCSFALFFRLEWINMGAHRWWTVPEICASLHQSCGKFSHKLHILWVELWNVSDKTIVYWLLFNCVNFNL